MGEKTAAAECSESHYNRECKISEIIAASKISESAADVPRPGQMMWSTLLIRQILGAVAQFDKVMTVAKLRGARDRKRRKTGLKVEGRKTYAEANPKLVELAHQLSEQRPRLSLREISAALASEGFTTPRGLPYSASAVASMLRVSQFIVIDDVQRRMLDG